MPFSDGPVLEASEGSLNSNFVSLKALFLSFFLIHTRKTENGDYLNVDKLQRLNNLYYKNTAPENARE